MSGGDLEVDFALRVWDRVGTLCRYLEGVLSQWMW